jgi:hypothetical protein
LRDFHLTPTGRIMIILCYCKDFAIRDHARIVQNVTKVTPVFRNFFNLRLCKASQRVTLVLGKQTGGIEHGLAS